MKKLKRDINQCSSTKEINQWICEERKIAYKINTYFINMKITPEQNFKRLNLD